MTRKNEGATPLIYTNKTLKYNHATLKNEWAITQDIEHNLNTLLYNIPTQKDNKITQKREEIEQKSVDKIAEKVYNIIMKGKEIGVEKAWKRMVRKISESGGKNKKWERTPTKKIGLAQKF